MKKLHALLLLALSTGMAINASAQTNSWTLDDCINYAKEHSITLKQKHAAEDLASINRKAAKAAWQPSLSFSTTQSLQWHPFQESATGFVNGTTTSISRSKATQSGNYGINASWTVWNGNRRELEIENASLEYSRSHYATQTAALSLEEEIISLYIQILYSKNALRLNESLLASDQEIYERGKEMLNAGQISKSDLASLETNVANGQYDIINAQTQISSYITALKQLLELPVDADFNIKEVEISEEKVLMPIPDKLTVYNTALQSRPEIAQLQISAQQSELAIKSAKSGRLPSVNLTAGLGDSHVSGSDNSYWKQMKLGFAANVGVSLNIPILDNRSAKSNIERARINEYTAQLDLLDGKKALYNTIENHWNSATNNQQKYKAAMVSSKSAQINHDYMTEAFRIGTKNIVELTQSRNTLLKTQNDLIQAQYLTLLYTRLLALYNR